MPRLAVLRLDRTLVLIQYLDNEEKWFVFYHDVQVERGLDVRPRSPAPRGGWRVGDLVSYRDRQNRDVIGRIERLNRRTATVAINSSEKWRVAYSLLFPVFEGRATEGPAATPQDIPCFPLPTTDGEH